jgi:D-alanyl-D-alanine carboxypeptidase/D-alanyl-D-alanine-endopeptidase (penicillin-binding protein 4)
MLRLRRCATALFLVIIVLVWPVWPPASTFSQSPPPAISGLGPHDALLVVNASGQTILSHHPDQKMVPASTLKVLTSLAAIHYLGPDFRFHTDFLLDIHDTLGIRGYGDPFLVSEIIAEIARHLADLLPSPINGVLLDESYFEGPITIPGVSTSSNPYDAPVGALCANFNTVFFTHVNGRLASAEPQTPLLPMVRERIRRSGLKKGRIVLTRRQDEAPLYAGNLFRYFLEQEGVVVRGSVGMMTDGFSEARLVYRHTSPYDLAHIIERLLEYSNNFTANQLLLAMGTRCYGPPATLGKGVQALTAYARNVIGIPDGVFVEGSGISRHNRLSVRDMITVLNHFSPHAHLMPQEGSEYYKTGTLKGVRTRVGYIDLGPGDRYRFALFRNRSSQTTAPIMRQVHRYLSNDRK